MRGTRFWVSVVAALLSVVCVPLIPSAYADTRSILVVHSGTYPEVEHVRAELAALNFQVTLLNDHQPRSAPTQLAQAARETGATVAIEFVVVADSLQVWLYDAATGNTPSMELFRHAAMSSESERVEALRVVEYLRAALIRGEGRSKPIEATVAQSNESPRTAAKPPEKLEPTIDKREGTVRQPLPMQESTRNPVPDRSSAIHPRPPSLWLSFAPGIAAMNALSVQTPAGAAGVVWQVTPQFAATLQGLLPFKTAKLASTLGTTEMTAVGFLGALRYNLARSDSQWRPMIGAGTTVFWLDNKYGIGVAAPAPTVELGLHWQTRETWSVFASLLAAPVIWVSRPVKSEWIEVNNLGRPAVFFASLGVEWRAVAWGTRD